MMWSVRLLHELHYHSKAVFVTLTYRPQELPMYGSLDLNEFTKFWKRLRKGRSERLKYYACGEYGEKFGRPHYHAIIFGLGVEDKDSIQLSWGHGHIHVGTVTYGSIRYTADYIQKKAMGQLKKVYGRREPPFMVCSNGLGKQYARDNKDQLENMGYVSVHGKKVSIPRYYLKFIYADKERMQELGEIKRLEERQRHIDMVGSSNKALAKSIREENAQREKNMVAKLEKSRKGF